MQAKLLAMSHNHFQVGLYLQAQEWQPRLCSILDQLQHPTNLRSLFQAYLAQLSVQPCQATTTLTILWRIMKVP